MTELVDDFVHPGLPLDVMQIVLGYINDTRSMAAARQVCKAWHAASAAATATVSVSLPGSIQDMRSKLALLLHVMPSLAGCHLAVGSGAAAAYPAEVFRQLLSFPALKSLELRFSDSLDLASDDITHLACLTALTRLHLYNASLAAATDSSPLLLLKDLSELSLVHHSKVSALLVGDSHLSVLGSMSGLTDLVLQGRMCSASDTGLLALSGLTRLHSLAISWVPWQSQITQGAALQLLSALKSLKTLQLGGAELLLPSVPHFPVAAVHAPPAPPAVVAAAEAVQPLLLTQLSTTLSVNSAAALTGSQTDHMRHMLLAKASELENFKLQFNCCGTGVEKALLALGDVCGRLTGLQWSYAKLSGPNSCSLLASCTSLTSLKLRLWYQDYNLRPFAFNLAHLTRLNSLRSLVVDKRPPFQQQLPVQQGAISIPLTPSVLQACTRCWPQLQKLQLGLARSDFGPTPLQGLSGFTQLKSLSVHCYDQGYDDGQYMLPIDITCLPSSLVKIDLMHAELFSGRTEPGSDGCSSTSSATSRSASTSASSSSSSSQRQRVVLSAGGSLSSASDVNLRTCSSICAAHGSSRSKHSCCAGAGKTVGKVSFAAASAHAFTSMLSESFSVLSRQASMDCSAAYVDQLLPAQPQPQQQQQQQMQAYYTQFQQQRQQQQQQVQALMQASGAGVSAFASATGAAAAAAAAAAGGSDARLVSSSSSNAVESHSSWLHDLMHSLPTIQDSNSSISSSGSGSSAGDTCGFNACPPPPPAAAAGPAVVRAGSSATGLSRQQSLPPLPEQCMLPQQRGDPGYSKQQQQAAARTNPFAAAAAAAAVHDAIGGCVAAVEPAASLAAATDGGDCSITARDQDKLPRSHSSKHAASSSSSSSKPAGKLVGSQSVMPAAFRPGSSSSSSSSSKAGGCAGEVLVQRAHLPHLQQLQLKHCSLLGVSLDDIVTKPLELRVLQLIEVCGLSAHDVALLPYLAALHRLTLIAAREDAWLGLAPLRLFAKLPELRHLDWVVSEKALSGRHAKAPELQALAQYPKLQVLTVHTLLGRCEQLHAVSGQLKAGCAVRLMTPAFCEHASKKSGFGIGRLLGVASCLLPGTVPVL